MYFMESIIHSLYSTPHNLQIMDSQKKRENTICIVITGKRDLSDLIKI